MRVKSIHIQNFRSFADETVLLNRYSCFVGPNGAGKSTVLAVLNVFFQEKPSSGFDFTKLGDEDYFHKRTAEPARITLTFEDMNEAAKSELAAYVRQDELVVTAEAGFDTEAGVGQVRHYGQRLAMETFRVFFDAEKAGARAAELNDIYNRLREQHDGLRSARSKDDKIEAMREYEAQHPDECVLIPSADDFYGVNSTGKLARFVQWVFVPAVKDASEEGQEAKNTALGKLIARAVRARTNFDTELEELKTDTLNRYRELLDRNQTSLTEISGALQRRLRAWAHADVNLGMEWLSDPAKSVVLQQPIAGIRTGEGDFLGSLSRMGHGLQRSYLLALLQELADSEAPDAPTLILGVEEPELYQHPPQARHLADVFGDPNIGRYEDMSDMVLTTSALLQSQLPNQRGAWEMDKRRLVEDWPVMRRGLGEMAAFLRNEGIYDRQRLPTNAVLAVIAALYRDIPEAGDKRGQDELLLKRYLWHSFFTDRYENSAATHAYADFVALRKVITGATKDDGRTFTTEDVPLFAEHSLVDTEELLTAEWPKRATIRGRAILAVCCRLGALDFSTGTRLDIGNLDERHYHHVFPDALLKEAGIDGFLALNCALISDKTNMSIGRKEPLAYLKDRYQWTSEAIVRERLLSHLIPVEELANGGYEGLSESAKCEKLAKDFQAFLLKRADLVMHAVALLAEGRQLSVSDLCERR